MYATGMVRVVWAKLTSFDLQPQMHKNYDGAIKGMHRVMLKYFKLAWMLLCMLNYTCRVCVGCHIPSSGGPV